MKLYKHIVLFVLSVTCMGVHHHSIAQGSNHKVDSLIVLFKDAGREWNIYADQLVEIGDPAVQPLVLILRDTSQNLWARRTAAMTLNEIRSPKYVNPALRILLDPAEERILRNQVTHGLKGFDLSEFADAIWRVFNAENDHFFQLNIAELLTSANPEYAAQGFEHLYQHSDGYVNKQAIWHLLKLKPQESSELYLSAIQSDHWMTANLAMDSLKILDQIPSGRIIRLYYRSSTAEEIRWRIVHVLGHRPERNFIELQLDALTDPSWLVHNEAALAITRMPPEQVLVELRYMEQSDNPALMERASWVISQLSVSPNGGEASMQPFDGYPVLEDMAEINSLLKEKCVDTISFQEGDIVADVGAGNGYLEAILSMSHNNLTFYIQDIDPAVCNPDAVQQAFDHYEEVNGSAFTSNFQVVIGSDTETGLPDQAFDKILMLWTYQYLTDPHEFMVNLRGKLKNDGLLYVINPDLEYEKGQLLNIEFGWNGSTVAAQIATIIGSGFELANLSRNYEAGEKPYIMVFRKR